MKSLQTGTSIFIFVLSCVRMVFQKATFIDCIYYSLTETFAAAYIIIHAVWICFCLFVFYFIYLFSFCRIKIKME